MIVRGLECNSFIIWYFSVQILFFNVIFFLMLMVKKENKMLSILIYLVQNRKYASHYCHHTAREAQRQRNTQISDIHGNHGSRDELDPP